MKVTNELIDHLAHLSRLEFSEREKDTLKHDLQRMIAFVEKLKEVDTDEVEPLLHMGKQVNAWREDEVKGSISRKEALKNAPRKNEEFFLVPRVINK